MSINNFKIVIKNELLQTKLVHDRVTTQINEWGLNDTILFDILLVLDEMVSNIIYYAYQKKGTENIEIELYLTEKDISVVISDYGIPFNPLALPEPDITLSLGEREIGGLGIHLVKRIMDKVTYTRLDNKNILTVIKNLI